MSDVLQVSFKGSPIRKRKDPIIAFPFPVAGLQDVKHANRFASKHKAWIRRGIVYDKHVERVARNSTRSGEPTKQIIAQVR
jgi:hypothetical protein